MTEVTKSLMSPVSESMQAALELPRGARFYRCALQINPFAYLKRHGKLTAFKSEDDYNTAIIEACHNIGIEVIAVTDHSRVEHSKGIVCTARASGLHAFNGFEATTSDGVHFLCLSDPKNDDNLERFFGALDIHKTEELSPSSDCDSIKLLELAKKWGAVCIAAHVSTNSGGLLKKLSGQPGVRAWTNPDLLACALPGSIHEASDFIKSILENKNPQYKRDRKLAILNASDVNDPKDLKEDSASCFIKMSTVSVEALRQAFLDPESRIRLHSDPNPEPHAEFRSMTWEGGFLDNIAVHFNENLNTLVGGRGTGKSTMVESIRYALGLDPLGEEARKAHEGIIKNVLKSGTKVSLQVQLYRPSKSSYTIERLVPNPPVVKNEAGEVLTISPREVMPGVEVFGQHEISELAKSPEKLTLLLERFVDHDSSISLRKSQAHRKLEKTRSQIVNVQNEMQQFEEHLGLLPGLEEKQQRFQKSGVEDHLKEKSLLVQEERLFATLKERLNRYRALHGDLVAATPIDTAFVSGAALEGLPNANILTEIEKNLGTFSSQLETAGKQIAQALVDVDKAIASTKLLWDERCKVTQETYGAALRELQQEGIDGAEFIQLRQQIEELRPLMDKMETLKQNLTTHEADRRQALSEWEDIKVNEYRQIENAAKKVSKKLRDRVRVEVTMAGNRDPLEYLLQEEVGGNLAAARERIHNLNELSLREFAQTCREGKKALMDKYEFPTGAAERISQAKSDLFMRIEELELPATTKIKLNTATERNSSNWRTLEALSTGQKATAVLLILLIESDNPLVVDQPEDDLDNRFITEGVVPIMRQEKQQRQFVFTTHNANIPVLGDAELILGLTASVEAEEFHARIAPEHMGSIDSESVQELVEEILEGGKIAFETRRVKYGF